MYTLIKNTLTNEFDMVKLVSANSFIPVAEGNTDYRQFLDDLNEQGTEIVDGELPESILEHAEQRKFQQQLNKYAQAVARLAKYILSEGRPEVKAMRPNGEQILNQETFKYEDVLVEMVIQSAIDPLPATVEIWEGDEKVSVPNPAIVQDEEQRAAAQAIVDATPQEVKDAA